MTQIFDIFSSTALGVSNKRQGTIFVPIPVEILSYDAERLASIVLILIKYKIETRRFNLI
jgi:hypothetical protein